ncbi:MAG: hypothetical protein IT368_18750, partial [Candidatus Hydrogenedentes bacterium]|nr:hypothetical protein [Candidatus Hydrogenedentota bacterium]
MRTSFRIASCFTLTLLICSASAWAPPEEMADAHTLVFNSQHLSRTVEEIPAGIRSRTTSDDPELVEVLQRHPVDMNARLARGLRVRCWDPLFAELADRHDEIKFESHPIDNGIEVTVTSSDAEVVKLIRAHAAKVSEFVSRGPAAMREATPLPTGYVARESGMAEPRESAGQESPTRGGGACGKGGGCCKADGG